MRYILLIADGCADHPVGALDGKTPLEYLNLPGCAAIAGGLVGLARTVPIGVKPGSDTAILTILGTDVRKSYTGRASLEAAGAGVKLAPGQTAFRVNLCTIESQSLIGDTFVNALMVSHNGCGIEGQDALDLMASLNEDAEFSALLERIGFTLHPSPTFRHIGVMDSTTGDKPFELAEPHMILGQAIGGYMPKGNSADALTELMRASYRLLGEHPINVKRGKRAANCLWPWAAGSAMTLENFAEKYHHYGDVVTAVPLLKGIAGLSGLPAPVVEGATGDIDTNYEAKLNALLSSLRSGNDFGVIHVEAPDECAHAKDVEGKLESLRRFDSRIVQPLLKALPSIDHEFRVMLLSDHLTLLSNGAHDGAPVPFAVYDSRSPAAPRRFHEREAAQGFFVADGTKLMDILFDNI